LDQDLNPIFDSGGGREDDAAEAKLSSDEGVRKGMSSLVINGPYPSGAGSAPAGEQPFAGAATPETMTDAEIMLKVKDGDDSAFNYLIEKYRQLTLTEVAPIKTAACIELWICAQDRGASDSSRNRAAAAMREANCGCVTKRDGSPDCGSEGNYGDPPW